MLGRSKGQLARKCPPLPRACPASSLLLLRAFLGAQAPGPQWTISAEGIPVRALLPARRPERLSGDKSCNQVLKGK